MAIRRPEVGLLIPIERPWPDVGMATLGVIFLVLVQHSSPLPLRHLLREVVEKVNEYGPFIGVVMAYSAEEEALISSGFFTPNLHVPWVDLSGRRFHIGTISDVDVIYVMSGQRRLNAGITVQILIDVFDVRGIVHYGTAGSANDSMSFGDVSVPKFVAFTGSWNWVKFNTAEGGNLTELSFGTYNLPGGGENRLAEVEFKAEEFYCVNRSMEEVFWLEMDTTWFQIAGRLKDLKLQRCVNETYCLPKSPKVVIGLKGSTADIFVDNAAYRDFLFRKFKVSTVDEESSAVVMTAMSSGVPAMVFRGVSDLAGGGTNWTSTSLSSIAASNSLTVAVEFIRLIGSEKLIGRN
ncbi:bark storage protein A-like isoform X1 [Magnolia sinica]|uniref:bark storage protein A-like isoform X1 n=1 Tax=Magnolia sinica TaxID=86752 RepID=UPI00265AF62D|nr:bark storage protein A-like isoform X1 [Magnolia sinica]